MAHADKEAELRSKLKELEDREKELDNQIEAKTDLVQAARDCINELKALELKLPDGSKTTVFEHIARQRKDLYDMLHSVVSQQRHLRIPTKILSGSHQGVLRRSGGSYSKRN